MIEAKTLTRMYFDGKPAEIGSVVNLSDSDFAYLAGIGRVEKIEPIEPVEPIEPIEPVEPVEPVEPPKPVKK